MRDDAVESVQCSGFMSWCQSPEIHVRKDEHHCMMLFLKEYYVKKKKINLHNVPKRAFLSDLLHFWGPICPQTTSKYTHTSAISLNHMSVHQSQCKRVSSSMSSCQKQMLSDGRPHSRDTRNIHNTLHHMLYSTYSKAHTPQYNK